MATARIPSDLIVDGYLTVSGGLSVPAGAIGNTQVAGSAAIDASKLGHSPRKSYAQPNTAATTETRVIHVAHGAGTILEFKAGNIVKAVGDSTVTVDLRINGTTALSSPISLSSASANYTPTSGTLSDTSYVDSDVLTVVITATVGTGTLPTGVYCTLNVDEAHS